MRSKNKGCHVRRLRIGDASVSTWALLCRCSVKREVRKRGLHRARVLPAPVAGLEHTHTVERVLDLTKAACLVRATVLQEWYAAHGVMKDLVIGVSAPSAGFAAHAWLEAPGELTDTRYSELERLQARRVTDP